MCSRGLCGDKVILSVNPNVDAVEWTGPNGFTASGNNITVSESVTSSEDGNYVAVLTDGNGCVGTETIVLTVNTPPSLSFSTMDAGCSGESTGSIDLTVAGGASPYLFSWSNSETSEDITNLAAGTYFVTVTDNFGCSVSDEVTISVPTNDISVVVNNAEMCGGENVILTADASGGSGNYNYAWSNGGDAATVDVSPSSSTDYTVTVTDENGCTATATGSVSLVNMQVDALVLTDGSSYTTLTDGGSYNMNDLPNSYTIEAQVSGDVESVHFDVDGTTDTENNPDYQFLGNTSDWTAGVGSYTVTVTLYSQNDAGGVTCASETLSFDIFEPDDPSVNPDEFFNYPCGEGFTVETFVGGEDGPVNINNSAGDVVEVVAEIWMESCSGGGPGSITMNIGGNSVSASGGEIDYVTRGEYIYRGSASGSFGSSISVSASNYGSCSPSSMAVYVVRTSPNGSGTYVVLDAEALAGSCIDLSLDIGTSNGPRDVTVYVPIHEKANDGRIVDVSASAGGSSDSESISGNDEDEVALITLFLPNVDGDVDEVDVSACSPSNGGSSIGMGGVSAGTTNCVTCTTPTVVNDDYDTCKDIALIGNVTDNDSDLETTTITITDDVDNGSLAIGDDGEFTYTPNSGYTGTDQFVYELCNDIECCESATVTIQVNDAPSLTVEVTDASCGDDSGSINLTVNGGAGGYAFDWDDDLLDGIEDPTGLAPGTYSVTVTDANGCTAITTETVGESAGPALDIAATDISCNGFADGALDLTVTGGTGPFAYAWSNSETTEDLSDLAAGQYTVTVTDNNGCSATATAGVNEPAELSLSSDITDVACFGDDTGAINLTISGGTTPYFYSWNGGETAEDISGLTAGDYTVTVTDASNCTLTETISVSESGELVCESIIATDVTGAGLANGSIDLTPSGGTPGYIFLWSNDETTEDLSGLAAGTYSVTITDANGCQTTCSATVNEPSAIGCNIEVVNVNCFGGEDGALTVSGNGGSGNYEYSLDGVNYSSNDTFSGLTAGIYTIFVRDADEPLAISSCQATISEPDDVTVNIEATNVSCNGFSDGSVDITVEGGTPDYTFLWGNGATTEDLTNLPAGNYSVIVTDDNGCVGGASITVTEPDVLAAEATGETLLCFGDEDGDIDLTVSGGTPPYSFAWDNGAGSDEDPSGLAAGAYNVTVTDANECTVTAAATISAPGQLVIEVISSPDQLCLESETGEIDIEVSGGTGPYNYAWGGGETSQDLTGLSAGTYEVTVTDANDCEAVENVVIQETNCLTCPPPLTACLLEDEPAYESLTEFTLAGGTLSFPCTPTSIELLSEVSDEESCPETVTRTYEVTDACGNTQTCTQEIILDDQIDPEMTCPDDITTTCSIEDVPAYTSFAEFQADGGAASDNCALDESSFRLVSETSDEADCPETITRIYEIKDLCGNTATCTQEIVIDNDNLPTISCPTNIRAICSIVEYAVYANLTEFMAAGGMVADACGIDEESFRLVTETSDNSSCPETVTRVYEIANLCGNTATCEEVIEINDEDAPEILQEPDAEVSFCSIDDYPPFETFQEWMDAGGQATDNCGIDEDSFTYVGDESDGGSCPETITRTYSIKDLCGNTTLCQQIIIVNDTEPPVLNGVPDDLTVDCDGVPVAAEVTATDNCGAELSYSEERTDGDCPYEYTLTRTWTAIDDCGNETEEQQIITVVDDSAPELQGTLPEGETEILACTAEIPEGPSEAEIAALYTDNCGSVSVSKSGTPTGDDCSWSVTYTYTIFDDCGNETVAEITYSGGDLEAPQLEGTIPEGETDILACTAEIPAGPTEADIAAQYTDNCSDVSVAKSGTPTGDDCSWTVTYTYVITDDCGNEADQVQITYSGGDTEAPQLVGTIPDGR